MPEDGEENAPETYREHRARKHPRMRLPGDADDGDPAEEFGGVGDGPDVNDVLDGDGGDTTTHKSRQDRLADALDDWDPMAADDDINPEPTSVLWSAEDFEDDPTERELLADIRDRLAEMNDDDARSAGHVEKGGPSATDLLGEIQDRVAAGDVDVDAEAVAAATDDGEATDDDADVEALQAVAEAYLSSGGGLDDDVDDLLAWLTRGVARPEPVADAREKGRRATLADRLRRLREGAGEVA